MTCDLSRWLYSSERAATTYTYDPAGNPTVSGTANDLPFLYQGGEKEVTDPGPLYYSGGGDELLGGVGFESAGARQVRGVDPRQGISAVFAAAKRGGKVS